MRTPYSVKLNKEEKKKIDKASKIRKIAPSTLIRTGALAMAEAILKDIHS